MFTRCPQCDSYFRVREEDLTAADGDVRCSVCHHTFNARDHLEEHPPEDVDPAVTEESGTTRDPMTPDLFENVAEEEEPEPARTARPEPEWLTPPPDPERGPRHPLLWTLGSVCLLLVLGAQLIHAERRYWVDHPVAGEWVASAYRQLGRTVEPPRNLEALAIRRADIAGVAAQPGALRVTGVVENTGERSQPVPAVYVRLEDRWGMSMGHAFFAPESWVHGREPPGELAPGETLTLRLDLADPGSDAVGFHLEVCWQRDGRYACRPQRGGAAYHR